MSSIGGESEVGLARVSSAVVVGVAAHLVEVEAHLASGLPGLCLVGLPDPAVNESRDRVRAAVVNSGLRWPGTRITVGLSPAWLPKRGPGLDLAIALAVLAADGQVPAGELHDVVALGELALDGRIRPAVGALAAVLAASSAGVMDMVTGRTDAMQAELVPGVRVRAAGSLGEIVSMLRGEPWSGEDQGDAGWAAPVAGSAVAATGRPRLDLSQIHGQAPAKRALEVAAAGGHHVALLGRAGVGKTLLAERLSDLLPDLTRAASLEVTAIHQLVGRVARALVTRPPCEAPHHTASRSAIVGGGSDSNPTVGVVSLAHRGVLFLDEAAEFQPNVLDALREPLDSGSLTVARSGFRIVLPARVHMIIATNPCPCGNALEARDVDQCRCTPTQRRRYLGRLSGPLMDRIDIRTVLHRPTAAEIRNAVGEAETTAVVAARVVRARRAAAARLGSTAADCNAEAPTQVVEDDWGLPRATRRELDRACGRDSMRGRVRLMRLAWTLADLADLSAPGIREMEEAFTLRAGDQTWAAA